MASGGTLPPPPLVSATEMQNLFYTSSYPTQIYIYV